MREREGERAYAPHGSSDDLHHTLVDTLAHADQRPASLPHSAQQQPWDKRPAALTPVLIYTLISSAIFLLHFNFNHFYH